MISLFSVWTSSIKKNTNEFQSSLTAHRNQYDKGTTADISRWTRGVLCVWIISTNLFTTEILKISGEELLHWQIYNGKRLEKEKFLNRFLMICLLVNVDDRSYFRRTETMKSEEILRSICITVLNFVDLHDQHLSFELVRFECQTSNNDSILYYLEKWIIVIYYQSDQTNVTVQKVLTSI